MTADYKQEPHVVSMLDAVSFINMTYSTWHVAFDLVNEFFPIPIRKENQKQFTFTCNAENYTFIVSPWGCVKSLSRRHNIICVF